MLNLATQSWGFQNPAIVRFGKGSRSALVSEVQSKRILIVTTARGRKHFQADPILGVLQADVTWVDSVSPNPGLTETQREIDRLAGQEFDAIVAFGGGSAMDAAKALLAALSPAQNNRDLASLIAQPNVYLNIPLLPFYALTTTSGTGAEVTPFATIWDHENRKKLSLASSALFAKMAIVDPELTYGLPKEATLSTSFDAVNQAFESVWNRNRSPLTTMMAARAIALGLQAIERLHNDLSDTGARDMIAEASLLAGLCISQTRTALCHSMSYPMTAHFGIAHGYACAFTMGRVAALTLQSAPEGLAEVAALAGFADAKALVDRLEALLQQTALRETCWQQIPDRAALLALAPEMHTPGRADNFILPVDQAFIEDLLKSI